MDAALGRHVARGKGPTPRGRRQGAPRAQAPLGNLLMQEVRPHRAELGAGLWGKPSALLEEVDTRSCVLKAKMEGEDGQQSAEGPRTAGVQEAREQEEVPKGRGASALASPRGTGAHTHLLDDHGVPQGTHRLQMLHELPQVRLEVREGGHLLAEDGVRRMDTPPQTAWVLRTGVRPGGLATATVTGQKMPGRRGCPGGADTDGLGSWFSGCILLSPDLSPRPGSTEQKDYGVLGHEAARTSLGGPRDLVMDREAW